MKFKLICFLGLILCMYGQGITREIASPLEYKISLLEFDKENRTLTISMCIKNISNESIVIDKISLSYKVKFSRLSEPMPNGGLSDGVARSITGHPGSEYEGDYLKLLPEQSYTEERTFTFDDEFFMENRSYKLSFTYAQFLRKEFENLKVWRGVLSSNEIDFRL